YIVRQSKPPRPRRDARRSTDDGRQLPDRKGTLPMKTLLLAASIVALSTAAHAGMSCNLTDQRGNVLQYSFAHGGHGYTNEIVVKRNGTVISNGGPMWARSFNRAQRTMTLEQAGWSIVYEAKPNDSDTSQAALFHNANRV